MRSEKDVREKRQQIQYKLDNLPVDKMLEICMYFSN